MSDRAQELSRKLAFWAMSNEADNHYVDKDVGEFVAGVKGDIDELKKIEEEEKRLEDRKFNAAQEVLKKFYESLDSAERFIKNANVEKSTEHPLSDLVFWGRLSRLASELYTYLQPRWDDLERLVVSHKLKLSKQLEKNKKLAARFERTGAETNQLKKENTGEETTEEGRQKGGETTKETEAGN